MREQRAFNRFNLPNRDLPSIDLGDRDDSEKSTRIWSAIMTPVNPLISIVVAATIVTFAIRASADIGSIDDTACETQAMPAMPRGTVQNLRHDRVKVRALVRDGTVREVEVVRGPRSYAGVIREAMDKYRCRVQESEFWVTQEFDFNARAD
jgi:hypothetical protein